MPTEQIILVALFSVLLLLNLLYWGMILWIICSWLLALQIMTPGNILYQLLENTFRPLIEPFSALRIGMFSLAPLILFIGITILQNVVIGFIIQIPEGISILSKIKNF